MSDPSFFKLRQYLDSYCDWLCSAELSDDDFHPKNVQSFLNIHLPKTFDESERDLPAIVFCDRLITRIVASSTSEQIRSFWEARLAGTPLSGRSSSSARKHFANRIAIELWSLNHDRRLPEIKARESSPSPPGQLMRAFGFRTTWLLAITGYSMMPERTNRWSTSPNAAIAVAKCCAR